MIKKKLLINVLCILSLYLNVQAQLHDKNWVFGNNNKITFIEDSILVNYIDINDTISYNILIENIGCISDSLGNLILHNTQLYTDTPTQNILNNGQEINIKDSEFYASETVSNGTIILNVDDKNYLYFYLRSSIPSFWSKELILKYHWIEFVNNQWIYKKRSKNLFIDFNLTERLKAIKHANGKDWWLIVQQSSELFCTDTVLSIHLSQDNIISINKQASGIKRCSFTPIIGEIAINNEGNKIAMAYYNDSIEVIDFNRCTGMFGNSKLFRLDSPYLRSYGLEFSPNSEFIYVNSNYRILLSNGKLQQIKLSDGSITDLIHNTTDAYQIERGPDDKLYFGFNGGFYKDSIYYSNAPRYLHCIENPDSVGLACKLNLGKVNLNNDFIGGLPNFPNYRLPSLTIFEAEAGRDTVICTDDSSSQKVVSLGSPIINGVQYQWFPNYNLSSDTTAQPLAFPDSTTWYYVTLTDTTIQDACQSRTDSVLVEVRRCSVGLENSIIKTYDYKIHPTLIGSELRGNLTLRQKEDGYVEFYNTIGIKVGVLPVVEGINELIIPASINNGLIIYRVYVKNKLVKTDKLIIQR